MTTVGRPAAAARGRPPRTSRRDLELIALRLFAEQGFEATTVEQIAAEAGVSKRTYFRYFDSKAGLLWSAFEEQVADLRGALADVPPDVPLMTAVRRAVVATNDHAAAALPEMRTRLRLLSAVGALSAGAGAHFAAWEAVVAQFVADRTGSPPGALLPVAVGRATLATVRAAYDVWIAEGDGDLRGRLDAALLALSRGFADL
jgi:mycofactocin system transcriptional regulator